MAQLSTFATTASNVAVDADERRITISSEVVEIDGVLDPPTGFDDWGGWEIICQSSGGFRSTSGASGTLGGGKHSLKIVEKTNGHRFGGDNFSGSNGANARFAGDGTNVLKYHNIVWIVETGERSDFDFGRGSAADGSAGPKVELSGVSLYQLTETGQAAHFNHYSGQASIKVHPEVGYGLRLENRTNGHAIEFSTAIQSGAEVSGLVVVNLTSPTNNGASTNARVAVRLNNVPTNGTLVLSNLNTPNITDVEGGTNAGSKTLVLIDPVGQPAITDNWGRHVNFEIRRTVPFVFTGATPAGDTMHARNQNSGGEHASASMSGSTGSIVVRTQRTANATTTIWSNYNDYRFFMTGLGFRKYALNTNQGITNTPSTITAALTPDVLPDGTAISSITAPTSANPPDSLPEILRAIKDVEVANPVTTGYPIDSLAYVEGNAIKINTAYSLDLESTKSNLIDVETDPNGLGGRHIDLKTGNSLGDSNGLTTIDATGTLKVITTASVALLNPVFLKDSSGQKSVVNITNRLGATTRFSIVNTTTGDVLSRDGFNNAYVNVSNNSTGSIVVLTKGLGSNYVVVGKRPGYDYFRAALDLTGGGVRSIEAAAQRRIVQPDGSASYATSVTVPNTLSIDFSDTGTTPKCRIDCGNATFSSRQIFRAYENAMSTRLDTGDVNYERAARYMGLGGAQMTYTRSALKGDEIVLGAHTKVRRAASGDENATIRATLYAPDDQPVDDANGDVQTIEGLDEVALSESLWTYSDRSLTQAAISPYDVWSQVFITSPTSVSITSDASFGMVVNSTNYDLVPDDRSVTIRFTNVGGSTNLSTDRFYYIRKRVLGGTNYIVIYASKAEADANQLVNFVNPSIPTPSAVRFNLDADRIMTTGMAGQRLIAAGSGGGGSGGFTATDRTNLAAIKTTTDALDVPDKYEIAAEVWAEIFDSIRGRGLFIADLLSQILVFTENEYNSIPTGVVRVRFTQVGGFGGVQTDTDYYAKKRVYQSNYSLPLYTTEAAAETNDVSTNFVGFTGNGLIGNVVGRYYPEPTAGTAEAALVAASEGGDAPTAAQNAAAVWSASTREITGGGFTSTDRTNLGAIKTTTDGLDVPTASENASAVWASDDAVTNPPSASSIATAVWGSDDAVSVPTSSQNASAVWAASGRTLSTDPPTASDIAEAVWDSDDAPDAPPSASTIATAVWGATDREITGGGFTSTDRTNLGAIKAITDGIDIPTTSEITEAIWSEVIDGSITGELVVDAEAAAGHGFVIPNEDAALIANGDPFTFTNNGGYDNLDLASEGTTYYAYIGNGTNDTKVLYVYSSRSASLTPGAAWVIPAGEGDPTSVRMVFPEDRPIGTAGVALHRILAAVEEIDQDHDNHSALSVQIKSSLDSLLGSDFVESGYSLQDTQRILLAILAGRLTITNNGGTLTFHRLDSGETAVIRGNASDIGRSSPTRNPT